MRSPLFKNAFFKGALVRLQLDSDRIVPCWRGTVEVVKDGETSINHLKQKCVNQDRSFRVYEMYTWVRQIICARSGLSKHQFYYDDGVRLSLKFCILAALGLGPVLRVVVGPANGGNRIQLHYTIIDSGEGTHG